MKLNSGLAVLLGALLLVVTAGEASGLSYPSYSLSPARPWHPDVTHFGGDAYRNHFSNEGFGTGMCAAWAVDLGRSSSQPLMVDGRIYHMAGDSLWALRADRTLPVELPTDEIQKELVIWRKEGLQTVPPDGPSTDSSPVYVDETVTFVDGTVFKGLVYAITGPVPGTNERSLVVVAAQTGELLGRVMLPPVEFISSPLVLPGDIAVFGSTDGYLWAVQGAATAFSADPEITPPRFVGGVISGSFVPVGHNKFLVGFDALNGHGGVMLYGLDLKPRWLNPDGTPAFFTTPNGVNASFAAALNDLVYFSDRTGRFYAINTQTGTEVWSGSIPGTTHNYVNNSPAVDNLHVYFTVRRSDGKGKIVAFSRQGSGSKEPLWTATLPGEGTTAPLIWGPGDAVLVGDTSGRVTAWRAPRPGEPEGVGQPVPFATQLSCNEVGHLESFWGTIGGTGRETLTNELRMVDSPFRAGTWWAQGSGASTELTFAHGHLLAGANGTDQDVFMAFRPGEYRNFEMAGHLLGVDEEPPEPGQIREATMSVSYHGLTPVRTVIAHGWANGEPLWEFVDLEPGETQWLLVQTPPVPEGESAEYVAVINPIGYDLARRGIAAEDVEPLPGAWEAAVYGATELPVPVRAGLEALDADGMAVLYEATASDNRWSELVLTAAPIDLQLVGLSAPATLPAPVPPDEPQYPLTATIRNTGSKPVDTVLRLVVHSQAMNGQAMTRKVHLVPGDNTVTITMPGSNAGDTITVKATVNPGKTVAEVTHDNNSKTVVTHVDDLPPPATPPGDWGKVDDWLND